MKKYIIIIIVLFALFKILYSQEINNYPQILISEIKTGNNDGELGYNPRMANIGANPGPNTFTISAAGDIYVNDYINHRINIYNMDFKFLKKIEDNRGDGISNAELLKIDEKNNIVIYLGDKILKINESGEKLFTLERENIPINIIGSKEFFIIDDLILFYELKNNDKLALVDGKGKKIKEDARKTVLAKKAGIDDIENNLFTRGETNFENIKSEINSFLVKNNIIRYDQRLLSNDIKKHIRFNQLLNKNKITERTKIGVNIDDLHNFIFLGVDSDKNSYWRCNKRGEYIDYLILVCSKYGVILDLFDDIKNFKNVAISPNGDVYFMAQTPLKDNPDSIPFYKVERQW